MTFANLIQSFVVLLNYIILTLSTLAVVIFLWGCVRYIVDAANEKNHGRDKKLIVWGLVALFVLFSLGGILRLLSNNLLGGPNYNDNGDLNPSVQSPTFG